MVYNCEMLCRLCWNNEDDVVTKSNFILKSPSGKCLGFYIDTVHDYKFGSLTIPHIHIVDCNSSMYKDMFKIYPPQFFYIRTQYMDDYIASFLIKLNNFEKYKNKVCVISGNDIPFINELYIHIEIPLTYDEMINFKTSLSQPKLSHIKDDDAGDRFKIYKNKIL